MPQCVASRNDCPINAACVVTNRGHYCACHDGFYNDMLRMRFTYPGGGECLGFCPTSGISPPCACPPGFIKKILTGAISCTDKCESDSDCPINATCNFNNKSCYCAHGLCNAKDINKRSCIPNGQVNLEGKCAALNPCATISPPCESPMVCVVANENAACECPAGFQTAFNRKLQKKTCAPLSIDPNPPTMQPTHIPSGVTMRRTPSYTFMRRTLRTTAGSTALQTVSSVGNNGASEYTTTQGASQNTFWEWPTTQKTEIEIRCAQYNPELAECNRRNQQDGLCTLLRQNANIQEEACQLNDTTISIQEVVLRFTDVLNHTALTNLTTSELQSAVSSIIEKVETSLLATFSKDPQSQNISTPELEVDMKASRDICGRGEPYINLTVIGNNMRVSCKHVAGERDGALFISYKELKSKLNGTIPGAPEEFDHGMNGEINSAIVSGAITGKNIRNMEPPVTFYLKQLKAVPPSFMLQCMFWDTERKDWSDYGCETKKSDRANSTLCVCNHLSTFAVLMAPEGVQHDEVLTLITRIGLSLSLFCLFLSILTFLLCRSIRSNHTSILTAVCGCLFLGQLLFLLGLHQTWNAVLCSVIAGGLQFFFLCAFCWMSLESILLYLTVRNLQAVNYVTSQRSNFRFACLVGFGIPLTIVITSVAIRPGAYGRNDNCWLHQDYVWSFLGPVCVFITINFILLVRTFVLLKKKIASLNANVSTLKDTRLMTFKALSQFAILGCTWIFGIFQFGPGALVMAYIFTVCNSLQGFYIFLVHCLLNHQVREEYRKVYRRFHSKKVDSEGVSGSTMPMTMKFSSHASEGATLEDKL